MARCIRCGKMKIFQRLQNNLCADCFEKQLDVARVVEEINESPASDVIIETAYDATQETISAPVVFDVSGLSEIDNGLRIITSPENKARALGDILRMNDFLRESYAICPPPALDFFDKKRIRFKGSTSRSSRDYCVVEFAPPTKTGKPPKYPVILHTFPSENLFGHIYYTAEGIIGKAEIITGGNITIESIDFVAVERTCQITSISTKHGTLMINAIYIKDKNGRRKVYGAT